MKVASLTDLLCPSSALGAPCHGRLRLDDGSGAAVPVVRAPTDADDILEGVLVCESCDETYPIIAGVLVLVDGVKSYLARNYSEILSVASPHIGQAMLTYLERRGVDLYDMGYHGTSWHNTLGMGLYISAHFDSLMSLIEPTHPLAAIVQTYCAHDLYSHILELAQPTVGPEKRVLDIGCNVGGMTWRLAPFCRQVFAIDYAFRAAYTARRILLKLPEPIDNYRLLREGTVFETRALSVDKRTNVEILVASGLGLPFAPDSFDLAHCANVTDVVNQPALLIDESRRVLQPSGHLVLTDPYAWSLGNTPIENWFGGQSGQLSAYALRSMLNAHWDILASEEQVLWILRAYDRHFDMWLVDCVLAGKRD